MSMNVVEKSRNKSVFGRNSKAAIVVPTGGPRNQSTGGGHKEKMTAPTGCLADKRKNDKDEV
jgi:hypothetical protein